MSVLVTSQLTLSVVAVKFLFVIGGPHFENLLQPDRGDLEQIKYKNSFYFPVLQNHKMDYVF